MYYLVVIVISIIVGSALQLWLGGYAYLTGAYILFLGVFVDRLVENLL